MPRQFLDRSQKDADRLRTAPKILEMLEFSKFKVQQDFQCDCGSAVSPPTAELVLFSRSWAWGKSSKGNGKVTER